MDEREGASGVEPTRRPEAGEHRHEHGHGGADGRPGDATPQDSRPTEEGRPTLAFVGAGQVGSALAVGLARAGWQVAAVANRGSARRERMARLLPGVRLFAEPAAVLDEADLIFLTVPDDEIERAATELHLYSGQALVHTSGALPASVLEPARAAGTSLASFHPLIAFADLERALASLHGATVALEGDESLLPVLAEMAEALGASPVRLPAHGKPAYHAAAVLAAGGVIGLLDAIVELGRAAGLDERTALAVYLPLVRQTLANAEALGIDRALTGPFVRGDVGTVGRHLHALHELAPGAVALYVAIARRELAMVDRRAAVGPRDGAGDGPPPQARAELASLLDDQS